MKTKIFELRDRATFIPILAIQIYPDNGLQEYLILRCGYPITIEYDYQVMITKLSGEGKASADPYFWGDRTFAVAHNYIYENFNDLNDGDVIDVEFILGETKEKKISERISE
jgi:hypothetical protein